MTNTQVAATTNRHLIRWVEQMSDPTQPSKIHWIDGSRAEYGKRSHGFLRAPKEALRAL